MGWLAVSVVSALLCIPLAVKLNINKGSIRNLRPIRTGGDMLLYALFLATVVGIVLPMYISLAGS